MFKNFVFVLISLFFFEGFSFTHAEDAHKEWLKQVLDIAQSQIIFSTTYEHEVKKNEEIIEEIDQIVTNALALYGEDLAFKIPCIRLLYIQGNYYLYKDRPILAQNKLLLAKNLCEKELSLKVIADDLLLFKSLSEQNLHLPSMYALILHLLGKALIYPKDPLNTPFHQKGFELIQKSILWRNLIDEHVSELNDDFDNNLIVGNTHIFKRTLGCAYLEREQWEEALEIFLECLQVQDSLNQIICLKNLVKIYQKKGKTASSPLLQNTYFQQGYLACTKLLNLIAVFPTIHRESVFFCIIGDFLADPATPFFDQEMACQCYKIAKKACHSSLKFLIKWSNEGLFNVLSDTLHQDNFLEAWQNYRENSCFDLLKRSLDDREFIEIFQEFGVIHQEKKNFIIASVFFTNAMSLAKKINFPSDFIEYRQYQLSKYFNATLTFDNYQWNLKKYKSLLDKLRNDLKNLKKRDVYFLQNLICNRIFQLLNEILNDFPGVDILKEDFALIAGGSLARKTMTPFSDLELAVLISKNVSEIKKQKILEIFTYLVLQITALEETPLYYLNLIKVPSEKCCKRGIMLDPALISPLNLLIISPEEFAKKIFSPTKTPSLSLTYINHDLIYGSFNLVESFQNHLKFEMSEHSNQIEQNINRDLKRWSPKVFRDHYGVSMSLKHDLYKPLFTTLDNFYALHGVVGSYNPWEQLSNLRCKKIINKNFHDFLLQIIHNTLSLRLKIYLQSLCQNDHIKFENRISFTKFINLQKQIILFQNIFELHFREPLWFDKMSFTWEFHKKQLKQFLRCCLLHWMTYDIPSLFSKLKVLSRHYGSQNIAFPIVTTTNRIRLENLLTKKTQVYGLEHPYISFLNFYYAIFLQTLKEHHEAIKLLKQIVERDCKIFGPMHLKIASYHYRMALSYLFTDDLMRAYISAQKAYNIHCTVLGEAHFHSLADFKILTLLAKMSGNSLPKDFFQLSLDSPFPIKKFKRMISDLLILDMYDLKNHTQMTLERLYLILAAYYLYPLYPTCSL